MGANAQRSSRGLDFRRSMLAYDQLPRKVRDALKDGAKNWACQRMLKELQRCKTAGAVGIVTAATLTSIAAWNAGELSAKTMRRVWGSDGHPNAAPPATTIKRSRP